MRTKSKEKNWTGQKEGRQKKEPEEAGLSREQMAFLQAELERTGVAMETVQERYKIKEPGNMSGELYNKVMAALAKTKPTRAA